MNKIHFIGGEKGGVGKSLVARVLAQYLIDHELPFQGFDTDQSHGALLRYYRDYAMPVVIDRYESLDSIIEATVATPERRALVDLAAQTQPYLLRWIDDSGVLDLADEMGLSLRYWHVMDSGQDAVDLLTQLLDRLGGRVSLVLVLNEIRGSRFDLLEASGQKARALELGARVMPLCHLQDATMIKIDGYGSSFWAAAHANPSQSPSLGLLERQRVKVWLKRAYQALANLDV